MTLGEKLLGASAVQTDASGPGSAASGNSNHRLSALQIGTVCMDPALILPLELLEIIFQLALPSIDIIVSSWDNRACRAHMAALYVLRRVSTTWKDVVDHTTSLWVVISSAFPKDVNSTSLVRSGSAPLVICFPGAYWRTTPPFREFLPTIEPHLQRCNSLALGLGSELVDEVPSLSLQRLVALKIRIDVEPSWQPSDVIPFTSNIEISDEVLENIRDIDLTRVPMDWAKTLEHLGGLRTLSLDGIYDHTITQEQILGVLAASPGLETLILIEIEIEDPPSSSPPSAKSISLPHLESITLIADGLFINALLRRIRPPPDIIELDMRPTNFDLDAAASFWEETMAPWIPLVQRLYRYSSDPVVRLISRLGCQLESYSEFFLFIELEGWLMGAALRWIQSIVSAVTGVDGGPKGLQVTAEHQTLQEDGVLEILQTMPGLTTFSVEPVNYLSRTALEVILEVLSEPTADSIDTNDPRPTFPTLQKLVLRNWRWDLGDITDMVQRRYSVRSTGGQQIPDLTLDISPVHLWHLPGRERPIISFPEVEALRELVGVKEVRMGFVMEDSGTLAVIWDEEVAMPAWG